MSLVPVIGQAVAKVPEKEDPGVIAWLDIFGLEVPVGFQFASALGAEGPLAWVLDIATDPTTWLGSGVLKVGKLTTLGRASRAATRGGKAVGAAFRGEKYVEHLSRIAELTSNFKPLGPADIARRWERIMDVGARLETKSWERLLDVFKSQKRRMIRFPAEGATGKALRISRRDELLSQVDRLMEEAARGAESLHPHVEDLQNIRALISRGLFDQAEGLIRGEIAKRTQLREAIARFSRAIEKSDPKEIRKAGKAIRKLKPSPAVGRLVNKESLGDVEALAKMFGAGGGAIPRLEPTLSRQAAKGQRSLLTLSMPFSDVEIPLVVGQDVFKLIDKVKAISPSIRLKQVPVGLTAGAGRASAVIRAAAAVTRPAAGVDTVGEVGARLIESLRGVADPAVHATENLFDVSVNEAQLSEAIAETLRREFIAAVPDIEKRKKIAEAIYTGTAGFSEKTLPSGIKAHIEGVDAEVDDYAVVIASLLDDAIAEASEVGVIESALTDYFPRIVRRVLKENEFKRFMNETVPQVARRLSGTTRHGRRRRIESWEDFFNLARRGVIEIEEDPAQILGEYFASVGRAMADRRLGDKMLSYPVLLEGTDLSFPRVMDPLRMRAARKEVKELVKTGDLEEDVAEEILSELDRRYTWIRKSDVGYPTRADNYFAALLRKSKVTKFKDTIPGYKSGYFVRNEELSPIRRMFEPGVSKKAVVGEAPTEKFMRNALYLNGLVKRIQVLWSAFHYITLTESGTAAVGWPFLKTVAKSMKDMPGAIGEFLVKGTVGEGRFPELKMLADYYANLDIVRDAVGHGLQLGALPMAEREVLQRALSVAARWGKSVGLDRRKLPVAVARGLQKRILSWDAGLWDVFHNGSKIMAYNELLAQGLQRAPGMPIEKIKRATAQYVNNAFGGQIWERFFLGRKGQELMRLILFAPDWTVSNLRVAWDVFANIAKRGTNVVTDLLVSRMGDEAALFGRFRSSKIDFIVDALRDRAERLGGSVFSLDDIMRADIRAMYARQYALRAGLMAVGFGNLLNYAFSGHFMDENAEGRKRMIELPYLSKDGKRSYLAIFKQFREPFEMLESPGRFLRTKEAIATRAVLEIATNRDIFGRPIAGEKDGAVMSAAKIIGHISGSGLPFPVQEFFGMGGRGTDDAATMQRVFETAAQQFGFPIRREFIREREPSSSKGGVFRFSPPPQIREPSDIKIALPRF